jgi:uncharacterized membrane protein
MPSSQPETSTGLSPRLAASLAYSGWWVTGLIFWALEPANGFVRFHAAQSIAAFGTLALIMAGFGVAAVMSLVVLPTAFSLFILALQLTWLAGVALWAVALWRTARGQTWRMPLAGDLADRMLAKRP